MLRQLSYGSDDDVLAFPHRKFRRVYQNNGILRDAQFFSQALTGIWRDLVKAREVHPHPRNLDHPSSQLITFRQLTVPLVHGEHQICIRSHPTLRCQQKVPLQPRGLIVKQISMDHIGYFGPLLQPPQRQPGEERRQGGMGNDQCVVFPPHFITQQDRCLEILRRPHGLLEGQIDHPLHIRDRHGRAPAGHVDRPAFLPEFPQIGQMEIHDVGACRRGKQHLPAHGYPLLSVQRLSVHEFSPKHRGQQDLDVEQ